jgi:hypothetical protein
VTEKLLYAGLLVAGALTWPVAVLANLNVPVAARVISFVQPTPAGLIPVAIVYQPGNAASEAEAADIERALPAGLTVGRASLRMRRVPVTDLSQLAGARAAFVTPGLRSFQDDIAAASAARSILTITTDDGCVQAGLCVVGISSSGRTQITVSKAAAKRSRIRFGSAFLMLVKEI